MPTRHVVLAHGIFRFDMVRILFRDHAHIDIGPHYFVGIADFLRQHGFIVHESDVNFCGSLVRRASDLQARLEAILGAGDADSLHIIGHSMGGLDARLVLAGNPAIAARISCVTTIGAPSRNDVRRPRARFGGDVAVAAERLHRSEGFRDLTTSACAAFNERVEPCAANTVRYRVVAAEEENHLRVIAFLQPTWMQLKVEEGRATASSRRSQEWVPTLWAADGRVKVSNTCRFPCRGSERGGVVGSANYSAAHDVRTGREGFPCRLRPLGFASGS
jgi:pimeloyl-ACP methyl ester carboxylesterase